jgi:rhodanese-related sulfurtransferase
VTPLRDIASHVVHIAPADAVRSRGTARLIDVREPHELHGDLGRIPGCESIPLGSIERAAATWDRDEPLVMICRSGARSARATEALVRLGFRRVMNLAGGMLAYRAAGLPVAPR